MLSMLLLVYIKKAAHVLHFTEEPCSFLHLFYRLIQKESLQRAPELAWKAGTPDGAQADKHRFHTDRCHCSYWT